MAKRRAASTTNNPPAGSRPRYELRATGLRNNDIELAIWQLPSPATPRLKEPERTAALKGRPLRLVENRVFKLLRSQKVRLGKLDRGDTKRYDLDEDVAMTLALLFRALAPMRSVDRIETVANGIERMSREESSYWLGMAIHRSRPRRVLAALRLLLTMP